MLVFTFLYNCARSDVNLHQLGSVLGVALRK